jgi:hypothetical protein
VIVSEDDPGIDDEAGTRPSLALVTARLAEETEEIVAEWILRRLVVLVVRVDGLVAADSDDGRRHLFGDVGEAHQIGRDARRAPSGGFLCLDWVDSGQVAGPATTMTDFESDGE